MKIADPTEAAIPSNDYAGINANLRFDLMQAEREVGKLKDYIYGLKMLIALLVGFMAFWFVVDVVLRAVGWFKSL